jgi:hypothetical protein
LILTFLNIQTKFKKNEKIPIDKDHCKRLISSSSSLIVVHDEKKDIQVIVEKLMLQELLIQMLLHPIYDILSIINENQ